MLHLLFAIRVKSKRIRGTRVAGTAPRERGMTERRREAFLRRAGERKERLGQREKESGSEKDGKSEAG